MKKNSASRSAFFHPRVLISLVFCLAGVFLALIALALSPGGTAVAQGQLDQPQPVQVGASYYNDVSPALRDVPLMWPPREKKEAELREANLNPLIINKHVDSPDPVVQDSFYLTNLQPQIPGTILNFSGIPFPGVGCNCAPPDTVGAVGQTQYVQMVNEGIQVFNKTTGASVLGPVGITSLWAGMGGACETNGSGDPIVLYDRLANRWLVSQFAGSPPTSQCIAISTTNDATGTYNRYGFVLGTNFFDYPHLAVWPDAYYMADNVFNPQGTARLGPQPFAFDRAKMLAGLPATFVTTGITNGNSEAYYLPADLDGPVQPPPGAPATFVGWPNTGVYKIYHFHADFITPANTTFTLFASPPAAGFTQLCVGTRNCVPQLGTATRLDAIADRFMHRIAYRNFGSHESVVANYTVSSGGVAGIRWVELRNVTAGPVTVFQEGTYQPDTDWRWMGSLAMDQSGNLALGYSASSATINPQIRYTGRLVGDPINTLPQGEATLFAGTGSQTGTGNRWGDYSAMTIDPVDDCTFWFTSEYYETTTSFNWRTRIGNFKFTQCTSVPTPVVVASGSSITAESCAPPNNVIDPNETVTLNFSLANGGTANTSNLVATLQPTGGVSAPSGPQNYGVVVASGPPVTRPFTFTATAPCGQTITATFQLQDGATNLGTATFTFLSGTPTSTIALSENFDGVTAPALPVGWVATNAAGVAPLWITSTTTPDTAPNSAFINDPPTVSDKLLDTQDIFITSPTTQISFRNNFNLESTFDGGVLEVSSPNIAGGTFTDITNAAVGGSFVSGGYTGPISTAFSSPISGRMAWSGNSGGYTNTVANLGPNVLGQNIKLRFRMASDSSVSGTGWRIDTIQVAVNGFFCCGSGPTPTPFPTPTPGPTGTATPTPGPTATPTPTPCGGPAALSENFDSVTAPALPAGWVATNALGVAPLWVTSTTTPDSAPNHAFIDDPATVSDKRLDTPNIAISSATAQISFRNNFALEPIAGGANFFDGGVLEVSSPNIAGGAFTDITNAAVGGSFVTGGYTGTISTVFMNPIGGRMAWSQSSGGYINTVANLGPNVNGQTIKLRFRMGSDNSVTGTGWRVDTIVVSGGCGPTPTPGGGTPTPTPGVTPTPGCTPISQGFDDITTLPGLGWVQTNHSTTIGTTGWFQGNDTVFPAQGGAPTSYIGANFNNTTGTNTISNWLLTPPVGLQNGAVLTFWTRTVDAPGFPDRLQVRMSTNGASTNVGTTATDVGDFTTLLLDINPTYTLTGYPSVWTQFTATVTGVPSPTTGRLALRYFVENGGPGGANSDYIGIDTLAFSGVCGPTPTPGGTATPTPTAAPTGTPCPGGGFSENFDGVTAPALPAGWVAANAQGVAPLWVTSIATPDTAPNSAFIDDPATVSDKRLDTPNIAITSANAQVSFRNNFALEPIAGGANFFDGGVLEVSSPNIAGGAFTDITNAAVGGSFVTGGYTGTISTVFKNPIGGRMAWSQSSGGYINTVANLGPNVNGQTIKLRFRMGSDNSVTGTGWRIDTIVVGTCGPTPTPGGTATPTPTPGVTPTPGCTPIAQGFDDITTLPGLGWVQTNHSTTIGTTGWFQGNDTVFPAQGGAPTSYIGANFNNTTGTNTISNWLLTPPVGLQNGAVLTFWTRTVDTPGFPDRLQVRMSTNGGSSNVGTTATDVGDFTALLLDINPTYTLDGYPNVWTQFTATVTGVPSPTTGRLALRYFVENGGPGGSNSDYIGIDTLAFNGVCGPTPTPAGTATPTPPPSPTPTATGTPGPSATPTATGTPGGTPTPTPNPGPAQALNLATRLLVQGGDSVGIGGFIITGTDPKEVLIRGIGPSLTGFGVPNALADPTLELNGPPPFTPIFNNNWKDTQQAAIKATGIPPTNDLESAILVTLDPGAYTAILRGQGDASGVALVEIYDLSPGAASKLGNIATRAFVSTGNDIVIAGFILGNGVSDDRVVIRGIGPSLAEFGVPNVLANPTLSLRNSDGAVVRDNDDWEDDPSQAALLTLLNLAPTNPLESGIVAILQPGAYTALLAGLNNGTGNALVEVYDNPVAGPTPTPGGTATPTPTPGGPTPTPGGTATPTPAPPCTEAFDGVSAPALPAGWVATNPDPGDGIMFVTTITGPDTAPNAAFINDQDGVSDKVLDSRPITVNSATAQIAFRNNFDTEFSDGVFWDGGVLEVSSPNIAAGEFVDITDPQVGGSFVSGAYTGEISGDASNPLAGRMAWSGSSGGYIDSVINLGANVNGQTITLRWRMGTDEAVVAPGWWVDTISFTGASCQ